MAKGIIKSGEHNASVRKSLSLPRAAATSCREVETQA